MRIITVAAAIAAALLATNAQASSTGNGTISSIISLGGGVVLFDLSGVRSATPSCHTIPTRWAFDGTSPAGQEKLAIILTAHSTGKQIQVIGKGTCDVWGDTESVEYIDTAD